MQRLSQVPIRYGQTLFFSAKEQKCLDAVAKDLEILQELLKTNSEFAHIIENPIIARANMMAALEEISKKFKFHKLTLNTLRVLIQQGRLDAIRGICAVFQQELMVERKQLHVQVITAKKQSKKLMSDFQEMMNKKTNSEIILEEKVDPSILGGAIIQYGSHKFDTSVKSKLEDLNNLLERFS